MVNKIKKQCVDFLKEYGIEWDKQISLFKKGLFIYATEPDWRSPSVVLSGFPTVSVRKAVNLLIERMVLPFAMNLEKEKREDLKKQYNSTYGAYDTRKYFFEAALSVLKDGDKGFYKSRIKKYTAYINTNRVCKQPWRYNEQTNRFEPSVHQEIKSLKTLKLTEPDIELTNSFSENLKRIKQSGVELFSRQYGPDKKIKAFHAKLFDSDIEVDVLLPSCHIFENRAYIEFMGKTDCVIGNSFEETNNFLIEKFGEPNDCSSDGEYFVWYTPDYEIEHSRFEVRMGYAPERITVYFGAPKIPKRTDNYKIYAHARKIFYEKFAALGATCEYFFAKEKEIFFHAQIGDLKIITRTEKNKFSIQLAREERRKDEATGITCVSYRRVKSAYIVPFSSVESLAEVVYNYVFDYLSQVKD